MKNMEKEELIALCKYFKGEKENPYGQGTDKSLWWDGERAFCDMCVKDEGRFDNVKQMLEEAIKNKEVSKNLVDNSIDINKRTLIYFLDIWHGKWYPYDDLDRIFTY